jgi:predicted RNA-binding protein with PIN domain
MTITSNTAQWMSNRELANAIAAASATLSDMRTDVTGNAAAYRTDPELHPAVREAVLDFNTLVTEQKRRNASMLKDISA